MTGWRIQGIGRTLAALALAGWAWFGFAATETLAQGICEEWESLTVRTRKLDLESYTRIEYNDNINASGVNPLADVILRAGVNFNAEWPVFRNNSIALNFDVGFSKYFSHPELDSRNSFLDISPDSGVQYCMKAGQFTIGFSDKLRFDADPTDSLTVDPQNQTVDFNVLQYNRFTNTGAINVQWDMNRETKINFGYQRVDLLPLGSKFDFARRTSEVFSVGATRGIFSNLNAGGNIAFTKTSHKVKFQNNSKGFNFGTYADWDATDFINLIVKVNWNTITFDNSGSNEDTSDVSSFNTELLLRHEVNRDFSHALAFYRTTNLGLISNSQLVNRLQYSFDWRLFARTTLTGLAAFEKGADSGGLSRETYDRRTFQINYGAEFKNYPITWNIEYRYTEKTSNIPVRNYTQNKLEFVIKYDF